MKKFILPVAIALSFGMYSCSGEAEEAKEEVAEETTEEVVEEEVVEEEEVNPLKEKLIGTWHQIAKDCDAEGENCKKLDNPKPWVFTETTITKNDEEKEYTLEGNTITIEDKVWNVVKEAEKRIIVQAVATDRYLKLEKQGVE